MKILQKGTVMKLEGRLGYFAWPSVTRLKNGAYITVASGYRMRHIDPFGRVVASYSLNGLDWTPAGVIVDTGLDNRDAGVCVLQSGKVLVTTFTSHRKALEYAIPFFECSIEKQELVKEYVRLTNEELYEEYEGGLLAISEDGLHFSNPKKIGVSTPHGPIQLKNGRVLYIGTQADGKENQDGICVIYSDDEGETWSEPRFITLPKTNGLSFFEPTIVESGDKLIVQIRVQSKETSPEGISLIPLTVYQCESFDGGETFTVPYPLEIIGSPPHLFRHSSGKIISTYGRREMPMGIRAKVSNDNGKTWGNEVTLINDATHIDLGYPCSTETDDGKILTVYYRSEEKGKNASIYYVLWELEE